jgi:phosphoglycolate phosphatase
VGFHIKQLNQLNIIFDFDGTLIDSKERLFKLFNFLVPESKLSFEEYWALKKQGIGHAEILEKQFKYPSTSIQDFQQNWHQEIEKENWISYDRPILGVEEKLKSLCQNHPLHLVTARQSYETALNQIKALHWENYFTTLLVTRQEKEKSQLILENITIQKDDWILGDTGKDILTGKTLQINTAAVLSGFLSKEKLSSYNPDIIIDSVINFKVV